MKAPLSIKGLNGAYPEVRDALGELICVLWNGTGLQRGRMSIPEAQTLIAIYNKTAADEAQEVKK